MHGLSPRGWSDLFMLTILAHFSAIYCPIKLWNFNTSNPKLSLILLIQALRCAVLDASKSAEVENVISYIYLFSILWQSRAMKNFAPVIRLRVFKWQTGSDGWEEWGAHRRILFNHACSNDQWKRLEIGCFDTLNLLCEAKSDFHESSKNIIRQVKHIRGRPLFNPLLTVIDARIAVLLSSPHRISMFSYQIKTTSSVKRLIANIEYFPHGVMLKDFIKRYSCWHTLCFNLNVWRFAQTA
jgi:hypothetical protein